MIVSTDIDTKLDGEMENSWLGDLSGSDGPKYKAIETAIRRAIHEGTLAPGYRLPPVRDLAWEAKITPGTVARAYKSLVEAGVLEAVVGRGTFVAQAKITAPISTEVRNITFLSPRFPDMGQGALIREAFRKFADEADYNDLHRYPSRDTDIEAREAFHRVKKEAPIGPFTVDDIVVASGGQSAITLILQTILKGPSPVVLVDELSYSGFRRAAEICRAQVISVPWDDEGPQVDKLEAAIVDHGAQVYCGSPEVCNPLARATSAKRREEIAALANKYDLHIVDDDCYRMGSHKGLSYRKLAPDHAWYVTSPSKSVTAALRIGFVVAPNGWANRLARTATFSFFGVARPISQAYAYVRSHPSLPGIVQAVRSVMNSQLRMAINYLGHYDIQWMDDVPFIWLELPYGWRSGEFVQAAEGIGILLKSAEEFGLRQSTTVHAVRIALDGTLSMAEFEAAIRRLVELLDNPPEKITV